MSRTLVFAPLLLASIGAALAEEVPESQRICSVTEPPRACGAARPQESSNEGAKMISGMSILGNQEAPRSLVIVPWKSSELGASLAISSLLDDSRHPIDKDVFMRTIRYYEIRSETARHDGAPVAGRDTAPTGRNAAQPATAAHRRNQ